MEPGSGHVRTEREEPSRVEMGPLFMLAAQPILAGKLCITLHICWLLFTHPADALALESFLQYAGERGGRERSAKENVF